MSPQVFGCEKSQKYRQPSPVWWGHQLIVLQQQNENNPSLRASGQSLGLPCDCFLSGEVRVVRGRRAQTLVVR